MIRNRQLLRARLETSQEGGYAWASVEGVSANLMDVVHYGSACGMPLKSRTLLLAVMILPTLSRGAEAPDARGRGPLRTVAVDYQFTNLRVSEVLDDRNIDIWARMYRPAQLNGRHPLLIFMTGNHRTCGVIGTQPQVDDNCQYTTKGSCPAGYQQAMSHEGYEYIADDLASWGYVVVAPNPNRGINCGGGRPGDSGLNKARGRLILKHLQYLSRWNQGSHATPFSLGVDLRGTLDFSQVGMMGHSRGGEGVRAAYNFYVSPTSVWRNRIPDTITFRGITEIGAVDGQTNTIFDAPGVVWNQTLPMCDEDVMKLEGRKPFDRMLLNHWAAPGIQKSLYVVWGANHNYFNRRWEEGDSSGCRGHFPIFIPRYVPPDVRPPNLPPPWPPAWQSLQQQEIGKASLLAFFRGNIPTTVAGAFNPDFNQNFNPAYRNPPGVRAITRVDRSYVESANFSISPVAEDFRNPSGWGSWGQPTQTSGNVTVVHGRPVDHDVRQRAAHISWTSASQNNFFEVDWLPAGAGLNLSTFRTLSLRIGRSKSSLGLNPPSLHSDLSVALVHADGRLSAPVHLESYVRLIGPVGSKLRANPILQMVRIPLSDFQIGARLIRGVRLIFDRSATGEIDLADLRMSYLAPLGDSGGLGGEMRWAPDQGVVRKRQLASKPQVKDLYRRVTPQGQTEVRVLVKSQVPLEVGAQLWQLKIGSKAFRVSRFVDVTTRQLEFTMDWASYRSLVNGAAMTLRYGSAGSRHIWPLGPLDKGSLR